MRTSLAFPRKASEITKGVVDGWQLVHVGLAMVRELAPDTWIYSFKKANLHPHFRVDFAQWCERIGHFLQGGESYKPEVVQDPYLYLPSFWHGMLPEQKKHAASIFASHGNSYSVACVKELTGAHGIVLMAEMQNLRLCLDLAIANPSHLERGVPQAALASQPAGVAAVQSTIDVNAGLISFQLHPKKGDGTQLLAGLDKFEHMVRLARRCTPHGIKLSPSARLDCAMTETQQHLLDPTMMDYTMQSIMATVHGEGAQKSLAKRKLDVLGYVRGACGWGNDPDRLKRLKITLELASSMAEINKVTADEKAATQSEVTRM